MITAGEFAHRGSIENLLGEKHDALCDSVSLENCVTENAPPTFLWHTWEDGSVPVENSLLLATALRRKGIPCELHIWQRGGHGMSLGNDEVYPMGGENIHPECQCWIDMAARWFREV